VGSLERYRAKNIMAELRASNSQPEGAEAVDISEDRAKEILENVLGGEEGLRNIKKRELRRFVRQQDKKWRNWLKSMSR